MRWAQPEWFVLLVLVPLPWLWQRARPRLLWPTLEGFRQARWRGLAWLRPLPLLCRAAGIACLVVALARPQTVGGRTEVAGRGVAIVIALDNSPSMATVDFPTPTGPVSRLAAAKATCADFIRGRGDDLIGLVVFANFPDTKGAPTLDHGFLLEALRAVKEAGRGDQGTNLGDAIAWSLKEVLPTSPARKVILLLTDGRNSPAVPNPTAPEIAARLARRLNVTLHTIAIGAPTALVRAELPGADLPVVRGETEGPDLERLQALARLGGGQAFVATDAAALQQVFRTIGTLETSPIRGTVRTRYREQYAPWVAAALAALVLDRLLSGGRLWRLP